MLQSIDKMGNDFNMLIEAPILSVNSNDESNYKCFLGNAYFYYGSFYDCYDIDYFNLASIAIHGEIFSKFRDQTFEIFNPGVPYKYESNTIHTNNSLTDTIKYGDGKLVTFNFGIIRLNAVESYILQSIIEY
ncbi:hypothetical protein FACS1894105_14490 [Clostridia bacterium]|nr:hypothetical protein FACS1894105_14490 [Clostridia bacterium]